MRKYFLIAIALLINYESYSQKENILKAGDLAPVLSPYAWLKGKPENIFTKGKVYVVEFGATWCTPCKAMIPVLSSLQNKHQTDLSVISVFVMERNENHDLSAEPTYLPKVKKYIEKQVSQMNYAIAIDDPRGTTQNTWLTNANRIGIPQIFIVDKNSRIAWIGSNPEALIHALDDVIADKTRDNSRDGQSKSLMSDNSNMLSDIIVSSTLSHFDPKQNNAKYIFNIHSFITPDMDEDAWRAVGTVTTHGQALSRLYYLAYSDTLWNQILSRNPQTKEFPDTANFPHLRKSYSKYYHKTILLTNDTQLNELFNYDLKFGNAVSAKKMQDKMRADLQSGFNYNVSVETRSVPCWILTLESVEKLQKTKSTQQDGKFDIVDNGDGTHTFTNADMRDIVWMLGSNYGYLEHDYGRMKVEEQGAFLDHTNVKWKFNFNFSKTITFEEFRKYLSTIGLNLSKGHSDMKVVVIKDAEK
jgi:thiol-disulfide isomerase/thioredoxin